MFYSSDEEAGGIPSPTLIGNSSSLPFLNNASMGSPRQRSSSLFAVSGNADFDALITNNNAAMNSPKPPPPITPLLPPPAIPLLEGYPLLPKLHERKQAFEKDNSDTRQRASSDPFARIKGNNNNTPRDRMCMVDDDDEEVPEPQPLSPALPPVMAGAPPKSKVSLLMRRSSAEEHSDASTPRRSFVISPFRSATPSTATSTSKPPGLKRSTSLTSILFPTTNTATPTTATTTTNTATPTTATTTTNTKPIASTPKPTPFKRVSSDISFSSIVQRLRSTSTDRGTGGAKSSLSPVNTNMSYTGKAPLSPMSLESSAAAYRTSREPSISDTWLPPGGRSLPSQSVTSSILSDNSEDQNTNASSAVEGKTRRDTLDQQSEDYEDEFYDDDEDDLERSANSVQAAAAREEANEDGIPDFATLDELLVKICQVKDRARRAFWLDALLSSGLDFNAKMGVDWFAEQVIAFVNRTRHLDVLERWLVKFRALHTCFPFLASDAQLMIVLSSFHDNKVALALIGQVEAMRRALRTKNHQHGLSRSLSFSNALPAADAPPQLTRSKSSYARLGSLQRRGNTGMVEEQFLSEMLHWDISSLLSPNSRPTSSQQHQQQQLPPRPSSNSFTTHSSGGGGHSRQSSLTFSMKRGGSFTSSLTSLFQLVEGTPVKKMDPRVVAEQLMQIMCSQAYCELTFHSLRTVEARKVDVYVQRLVRMFEVLSYWPVTEILLDSKRTASERIDDFGFFCQLARESRKLGNFHAVFALVGSLQSPLLRWVEDLATRKDQKDFHALKRLCRTDNNYKVYFADLSKRDKYSPCVPYLGLLNRTLLNSQCEVPLFSPQQHGGGDQVNFLRCRRIWKEITNYLQFQSSQSDWVYVEDNVRRALGESMSKAILDYTELTTLSLQAKASYKKSARQRAFHRARAMGHQIVGSPDAGI